MKTLLKRSLALAGILVVACPAHAGPTGLFLMPIADILKNREANLGVSAQGYERNVSKGLDYDNGATVGLFDRIEVGYDSDFLGTITGNAKLQLFERDHAALSVGVANWRGDAVDPYVVGRFDGKGYRLHAGVWRTGGAGRLMVGTDFPAGPGLTGSVEFLGGPGARGWAALAYNLPFVPGLSVQVAGGVPVDHAAGLQYGASVSYALKL